MRYMKPLNLFHEVCKTNGLKQARFLGLDVGDKYVGLAVSDTLNEVAAPLSVLERKKSNIELMACDFQHLICELSLGGFIVGFPFNRNRDNKCGTQIKLFIDNLCETNKLNDVRFTYWDESFTTRNVDLLLKPLNWNMRQSKTVSDKFAAVGILQEYLDYVNRKLREEEEEEE